MARRRRKPAYCKHPTCSSGECRKCAWNPRSGYPAVKVTEDSEDSSDSSGKGRIRRPAWLALVVGLTAGFAARAVFTNGIGCLLFVLVVTFGLIAVLKSERRVRL